MFDVILYTADGVSLTSWQCKEWWEVGELLLSLDAPSDGERIDITYNPELA